MKLRKLWKGMRKVKVVEGSCSLLKERTRSWKLFAHFSREKARNFGSRSNLNNLRCRPLKTDRRNAGMCHPTTDWLGEKAMTGWRQETWRRKSSRIVKPKKKDTISLFLDPTIQKDLAKPALTDCFVLFAFTTNSNPVPHNFTPSYPTKLVMSKFHNDTHVK